MNKLELLKKVFRQVLIPRAVKQEVLVAGKEGLQHIQNALAEGWLKIVDAKMVVDFGLGQGENAAISLARERKEGLILDDAFALRVAQTLGVETLRTTSIIFMALQKKIIDRKEGVILLNKLIETGYYISPQSYSVLLTRLTG